MMGYIGIDESEGQRAIKIEITGCTASQHLQLSRGWFYVTRQLKCTFVHIGLSSISFTADVIQWDTDEDLIHLVLVAALVKGESDKNEKEPELMCYIRIK